ncbi:MAG: MgtC/SapB family protein [Clostridia bacterium]|nr:MgtC/SapB family protein [Clostridia bacterium]
MNEILELLQGFNIWSVAFRVMLAALCGGLIGSERGRHGRAAGMRTHILVCLGSALTAMTGLYASEVLGYTGDVFRISAQVVSGIGFLGAGTILVRNHSIVTGLTTAAGMWATASIGIALGYGFYSAVLAAMLLCVILVPILGRVEYKRKLLSSLYVEVEELSKTGVLVEEIRALMGHTLTVQITAPKSSCSNHVGLQLLVRSSVVTADMIAKISALDGVLFLVEEDT